MAPLMRLLLSSKIGEAGQPLRACSCGTLGMVPMPPAIQALELRAEILSVLLMTTSKLRRSGWTRWSAELIDTLRRRRWGGRFAFGLKGGHHGSVDVSR